ncbi:MAG: HK97 family phage prohead protease, partial [Microbacteriaceae bacterium]
MQTLNLNETQTRSFHARAAADESRREISGIGVPLESEVTIWPGFNEVFDRECVFDGIERAKLKRQHRELIGVVTSHNRTDSSLEIVGSVSKIPAGDDALALAADGALDSFSIGFRSIEYVRTDHEDGSFTIRHTRVAVSEYSLTDTPAYTDATVTDVREAQTPTESEAMPTDTLTREDFNQALDSRFEEQQRSLDARIAQLSLGTPQPTAQRSAGAMLAAIADGDETALREYNETIAEYYAAAAEERAYQGGTTADAPSRDGWVGDLTRIFDSSSGVLSEFFSTGPLPETGMNVEYAQLKSNTVSVEEQKKEGDDLKLGKVQLETKTAKVLTYGGYTQLSVQAIKRSTLPILNRSLEALTVEAGASKKRAMRAEYLKLVAARLAAADGPLEIGATLADATAGDWTDLVVDAAVRFSSLNLPLEAMIASTDVFKALNRLEIGGKRVFRLNDPNGFVGTLDLTALRGDLSGVTVLCDPDRTAAAAEFVNHQTIRAYASPLVQLQDENIVNLSRDYSAYRFGAIAPEIPAATVPVKFGA